MPNYYPPTAFHFRVEFNLGKQNTYDTSFQEVGGLSAEIPTEDLAEGGVNTFTHRLPGRVKFGNLVLKRGMLTNSEMIQWFKDAIDSYIFKPIDVSVHLLNKDNSPIVTWNYQRAWPVKWVISDLKASDNAIVVESVELAYRRFERKGELKDPDTILNQKQSFGDAATNAAIGILKRSIF
ncbi:MAG: putative phage tail protein [Bacteroidetes bacterium]|nr:MAG: putative phage tail protein [Bacteroidota bacterium]